MESLTAYFQGAGFTETEAIHISGQFVLQTLEKGDLFVEEGKMSRYLGFVEKGFLQYFLLIDGEEKTTYTTGENNFVASLTSFLKETPAKENIRAVVKSFIWVIDRTQLMAMQESVPGFRAFYIQLLEWQLCCIDESRLDGLLLNARQRYEKILEKEPQLIQQIPLQYLASILGITPRHLSRIRGDIR